MPIRLTVSARLAPGVTWASVAVGIFRCFSDENVALLATTSVSPLKKILENLRKYRKIDRKISFMFFLHFEGCKGKKSLFSMPKKDFETKKVRKRGKRRFWKIYVNIKNRA